MTLRIFFKITDELFPHSCGAPYARGPIASN